MWVLVCTDILVKIRSIFIDLNVVKCALIEKFPSRKMFALSNQVTDDDVVVI